MLRFRTVTALTLGALVVVALSGCASQASRGSANALEVHPWKVAQLGDTPYSGSADITAKFSDGMVDGSTGVNIYGGTYETPKGDEIAIALGPMTLRAGPPEAMKAESEYLQALKDAKTYTADDTSLKLMDEGGATTVEYVVDTPTALVGTNWTMTMYNNGHGGFQSAETSSVVTAVFAQDWDAERKRRGQLVQLQVHDIGIEHQDRTDRRHQDGGPRVHHGARNGVLRGARERDDLRDRRHAAHVARRGRCRDGRLRSGVARAASDDEDSESFRLQGGGSLMQTATRGSRPPGHCDGRPT